MFADLLPSQYINTNPVSSIESDATFAEKKQLPPEALRISGRNDILNIDIHHTFLHEEERSFQTTTSLLPL